MCDVDFVRIDSEGSEPKLTEAMMGLGPRVKSSFIEFSQFTPMAEYISLAMTLMSLNFDCFDQTGVRKFEIADAISEFLRSEFAASKIAVTKPWFVARP